MSDPKVHKYVKQTDGDVICEWCGVSREAKEPGCREPAVVGKTDPHSVFLLSVADSAINGSLEVASWKFLPDSEYHY